MVNPDNRENYGHYSDFGDEFIITRFDTPKPWLNYSWNRSLLSSIDQRGRGSAVYRSPSGERTNLIQDRIVYIKDRDSGDIWTVGWDPVQLDFTHYRCRHGLGYTAIESHNGGIVASCTITSASRDPVELWTTRIENASSDTRHISVYPYVEFDLDGPGAYGGVENYTVSRFRSRTNTILAINQCRTGNPTKSNCFFHCDAAPDDFQISKYKFLGSRYGSLARPKGVAGSALGGIETANEPLIGAMQYDLVLRPGQIVEFRCIVGPFAQESEVSDLCERYSGAEAFDEVLRNWRQRCKCFLNVDIDVRDDYLNPLFNTWTKHQLSMLMDWSRGWTMGFRDTLQDAQAYCALDPAKSRESIVMAASHQMSDGSALRGYWPVDSNKYADGGVWLALACVDYVKETGVTDILNEEVRFNDEGSATVFEHVCRGLSWISQNPGEHGLARVLFGDWNDSLNIGIGGKGESVWLSMALVQAAREMAELARFVGRADRAQQFTEMANTAVAAVQSCWDGRWYLRGYTDQGEKVGSAECKEGRIFAETQTWAILAGITPHLWDAIEASMQEHLMTDYGLLVCQPGFKEYDPALGRITTIPAGWGENGSSYCHVSAFKAVADCVRRDGDAALDSLIRILACNPANPVSRSGAEPYGFTNMFRGPEHPQAGLSLRSWYTGTVGWAFRCVTQWMLGVRPTYKGLLIDPVMPKAWPYARMLRRFRGAQYDIQIEISSALEKNDVRVSVDGSEIRGNLIRLSDYPDKHEVRVTVGNAADGAPDMKLEAETAYGLAR